MQLRTAGFGIMRSASIASRRAIQAVLALCKAHAICGAMDLEALLSFKTVVVGAFLLLFLIYERVRPAVDNPLLVRFRGASAAAWRRLARNTGLFGINLLVSPLIVLPITVWAGQFSTGLRPAWLSGWTGLAVDLVLLDFWIYWWHRANHELSFLWRFHQVHHFDELLDSTTALRFHFGEVVLSALVRAG